MAKMYEGYFKNMLALTSVNFACTRRTQHLSLKSTSLRAQQSLKLEDTTKHQKSQRVLPFKFARAALAEVAWSWLSQKAHLATNGIDQNKTGILETETTGEEQMKLNGCTFLSRGKLKHPCTMNGRHSSGVELYQAIPQLDIDPNPYVKLPISTEAKFPNCFWYVHIPEGAAFVDTMFTFPCSAVKRYFLCKCTCTPRPRGVHYLNNFSTDFSYT